MSEPTIIIQQTPPPTIVEELGGGRPGSPGAPGAPGKSAYDLWLDAGNVGTEADFFASLKGDKGDPGAPGTGGGGLYYEYDQLTPATVWVVHHGFGKSPEIRVVDSGGTRWYGDEKDLDTNTTQITFGFPMSGKAICTA